MLAALKSLELMFFYIRKKTRNFRGTSAHPLLPVILQCILLKGHFKKSFCEVQGFVYKKSPECLPPLNRPNYSMCLCVCLTYTSMDTVPLGGEKVFCLFSVKGGKWRLTNMSTHTVIIFTGKWIGILLISGENVIKKRFSTPFLHQGKVFQFFFFEKTSRKLLF